MAKKDVKLTRISIEWILERFFHYALGMIIHGYTVSITRIFRFKMYYVNSSDMGMIDREAMFARSGAIHGVYFSISCEGKFQDEYKARFKPLPKFRQMMEERLDDPDLAYKLIT